MRIGALRRHWERFGRRDPLWAVLTDPEKRRGKWDIDGFFRSGVDEIDAVLRRADTFGLPRSRRSALDFGCGAGRLTQAMAAHFSRCDGVDISESMLDAARRHNGHPDRCTYHLNTAPDLAQFADARFDFVYSTLVLQHMRPRYSHGYLRELVRVLAPGGLLVVQMPSDPSTQDPPPGARQTSGGPLPRGAFQARLTTTCATLSARPGEQLTLDVTIDNRSPHIWSVLPDARGLYQINVANHWLGGDGAMLQRDDRRCPLAFDVEPGSSAQVTVLVTAPQAEGAYWLELDLVQEGVGWFGERGSPTLRLPCLVGNVDNPQWHAPVVTPAPPRFRERHPVVFRAVQATGVRDAYWVWRRALDRAKTVRDAVMVGVRDRLYTPYAPHVINWWRRGPFSPQMEMYCVPRGDVLAILTGAGGRVLDVEEHAMPPYQSYRYWVTRDG